MTDTAQMLKDSADRLFGDAIDEALRSRVSGGAFPDALWTEVEEMGLPRLFDAGEPADAHAVLRAAGYHAAPVPLAETMIAHKLLLQAGLDDPGGVLTVAPVWHGDRLTAREAKGGWTIEGHASGIPWLDHAGAVVIAADAPEGGCIIACLEPGQTARDAGRPACDEPRGDVTLKNVQVGGNAAAHLPSAGAMLRTGALLRASQMAGALESVLDITVRYVGEREQFGRPLAKFQAIQQQLARLANEASAGAVAARDGIEALEDAAGLLPAAAAKARLGEAASRAAAIAHQAHGAIGFTAEYALQHRTRRLWTWRDDFGTERYWQDRLGAYLMEGGADALWPLLSGTE